MCICIELTIIYTTGSCACSFMYIDTIHTSAYYLHTQYVRNTTNGIQTQHITQILYLAGTIKNVSTKML